MDNQEPVVTANQEPNNPTVNPTGQSQVNLSEFFVDNNPGVFDQDKIIQLAQDREVKDKSAKYFQSLYMKKSGASENIEDYLKDFQPDSSYADIWNGDKEDPVTKAAHEDLASFKKFAHENKISTRDAQLMFNYYMQEQVKFGVLEKDSPEKQAQKKAELIAEIEKEANPILSGLNRTKADNDAVLNKFIDSTNIITANPDMKDYLKTLMNESPKGYKLVTLLTQSIEHQGIPVVSGTIQTKDKAAFEAQMAKESNPEIRDAMMREFYGAK